MGRRLKTPPIAAGPHPFGFLAKWRANAGLTQSQVASHFGVSDVTVHRWETGKAPVTVRDFVRLAQLYHADHPGALMFPPSHVAQASMLREINDMLMSMDASDRSRWVALGRSLAEKKLSASPDISTAA
jgi:transcriptional regulator with XRE-family HTH domain